MHNGKMHFFAGMWILPDPHTFASKCQATSGQMSPILGDGMGYRLIVFFVSVSADQEDMATTVPVGQGAAVLLLLVSLQTASLAIEFYLVVVDLNTMHRSPPTYVQCPPKYDVACAFLWHMDLFKICFF